MAEIKHRPTEFDFTFNFKRKNILLGTNGSGKSRFLKNISIKYTENYTRFLIEHTLNSVEKDFLFSEPCYKIFSELLDAPKEKLQHIEEISYCIQVYLMKRNMDVHNFFINLINKPHLAHYFAKPYNNARKLLKNNITPNYKAIMIEGGRTLKSLQGYISLNETENALWSTRQQKVHIDLSNRLKDNLEILINYHLREQQKYADKCAKIYESRNGTNILVDDKLKPHQTPFREFQECIKNIFPYLMFEYNPSERAIKAYKNSVDYTIEELSDGEKQVFTLLIDFLISKYDEKNLDNNLTKVILVDEPELNLNPKLALDFWQVIEKMMPEDYIFIYATHHIGFAMMNDVDNIFVLSNSEIQPITKLESKDINDIPKEVLSEFLGNIPSIVQYNKILLVEGKEQKGKISDKEFYEWLLKDTDIKIIPVGSCKTIKDIFSGKSDNNLWDSLNSTIKIRGVIDRDFNNEKIQNSKIKVLDYLDKESYLMHPNLLGVTNKIDDKIVLENKLLEYLLKEKSNIINEFLKSFNQNYCLEIKHNCTLGDAISSLKARINEDFNEHKILEEKNKIEQEIDMILQEKDLDGALKYLGKKFFNSNLDLTRMRDYSDYFVHLKDKPINDFKHLSKLREDLIALFNLDCIAEVSDKKISEVA